MRAIGLAVLLGVPVAVDAAADGASNAVYVLNLSGAVDGRNLALHLAVENGAAAAALATGYNAATHDVRVDRLSAGSGGVTARVDVTIAPDAYLPTNGQPLACAYGVTAQAAGTNLTGVYTGLCAGVVVTGRVDGTRLPDPPPSAYTRLDARFLGALHRLYALRGPNWRYALDMKLIAPMADGAIERPRFETIVPDYRRYSAVVTRHDLRLEGHRLTGSFTARVDTGGQGAGKGGIPATEDHVFTVDGLVVGDTVGGSYTVTVGELTAEGKRFAGRMTAEPPPLPAESTCVMRLHGAMRDGSPVVLNLSLANPAGPHGLAWAPGYNHQAHDVDAWTLEVTTNRIRGPVSVTIAPDCYRPPETFAMDYQLDATVVGGSIEGTFTGVDRGSNVAGAVTGELRRKAPRRFASLADVARCDLSLGYCLVTGPMPKKDWETQRVNQAVLRYRVAGGEVQAAELVHPDGVDAFHASPVSSTLRLEGDGLSGSAVFDLVSAAVRSGRYVFTFRAVVDGGRASGYWRGTRNGEPILTKSAKLSGAVTGAE